MIRHPRLIELLRTTADVLEKKRPYTQDVVNEVFAVQRTTDIIGMALGPWTEEQARFVIAEMMLTLMIEADSQPARA